MLTVYFQVMTGILWLMAPVFILWVVVSFIEFVVLAILEHQENSDSSKES